MRYYQDYPRVKWNRNDPQNNHCARCGISQVDSDKLPPVKTGINHPEYAYTKSFSLALMSNSDDLCVPFCPRCHREYELESCIESMDNYAKKHGEKALSKLFEL